jgi:hypothetical protein
MDIYYHHDVVIALWNISDKGLVHTKDTICCVISLCVVVGGDGTFYFRCFCQSDKRGLTGSSIKEIACKTLQIFTTTKEQE